MQLINIGFGNIVSANRIISIVNPDSAPIKRLVQEAKDSKMSVDATSGRRTRAVIIMDSGHVILSAVQPETVAARLDKDINKKIAENEEFVRYTFFELKVRHNLSEDEIDEVLRLARNKFENLGYRVYFTGAKYNYQGENRIVESNEYLVAIKGL